MCTLQLSNLLLDESIGSHVLQAKGQADIRHIADAFLKPPVQSFLGQCFHHELLRREREREKREGGREEGEEGEEIKRVGDRRGG